MGNAGIVIMAPTVSPPPGALGRCVGPVVEKRSSVAPVGEREARRHRPRLGAMAEIEYRTLGRSGLLVSAVGLGCNNFGRPGTATETQEGTAP